MRTRAQILKNQSRRSAQVWIEHLPFAALLLGMPGVWLIADGAHAVAAAAWTLLSLAALGCHVWNRTRPEQGVAGPSAETAEEIAERLSQVKAEFEQFTYAVSHDLREPLRGIDAYSRFLLEDYGDRLDGEGLEMLQTLPQLSSRMASQLESLKQLSQISRRPLDLKETDTDELVRDVLTVLDAQVDRRKASISIAGILPTLCCDPAAIRRVFESLLDNATKFSDRERPTIEIGAEPEGAETTFYIRDDGIGIPEKNLQDVFRIFRRMHGRQEYGGGVGAGLTISRKTVERHGGRIWAECTPGQATVIRFTLPQAPR